MLNKINKKRIMKELLALITAFTLTMPIAGCSRKDDKSSHEDISEVTGDDYYNDELSEEEEMERLRMSMIINDYIINDYSDSKDDKSRVVTNSIVLDKVNLEDNCKMYFAIGEVALAYAMTIDKDKYAIIDSNNFGIYYGLFKVNENEEIIESYFAKDEADIEKYFTDDAHAKLTEDCYYKLDRSLGDMATLLLDANFALESLYLNPYINGDFANVYHPEERQFIYQTKDGKVYNNEESMPLTKSLIKLL